MICSICGRNIANTGMPSHLIRKHSVTPKEYYNSNFIGPINKCLLCHSDTPWVNLRIGYRKYCSQYCARIATIEKTKKKYNVDNISQIESVKKLISKKVKDNWDNLSEIDKETRCTNIRNSTKQSMQIATQKLNEDIDTYCKNNQLVRLKELVNIYGTGFMQTDLIQLNPIIYKNRALIHKDKISDIEKYVNIKCRSRHEYYLYELIKYYYSDAIQNKKILGKQELDIYVPSIKLAIEYNGNFYHCIEHNKSIDYHLNKSILCRQQNIRLIHIYEFEDFNTQIKLLIELLENNDMYNTNDFNKNNLIANIPKPEVVYKDSKYTIYGAGKLL